MSRAHTLLAMAVALDPSIIDRLPQPDVVDCGECKYNDMPRTCGHCYMFMDPPEDNRCGAFERKR